MSGSPSPGPLREYLQCEREAIWVLLVDAGWSYRRIGRYFVVSAGTVYRAVTRARSRAAAEPLTRAECAHVLHAYSGDRPVNGQPLDTERAADLATWRRQRRAELGGA